MTALVWPGLQAQDASQDTTEFILKRVIRDFGRLGFHYQKGYWSDRLTHRREFYEPIQIIPLELGYGLFANSGAGLNGENLRSDFIQYESPVEHYDGGKWTSRIGQQLELDLLKSNLSQYILKSSWMDVHTGINLRYASLFSAPSVPSSWGVGAKQLAPRILEGGLSTSFILQWFDLWYLTGRYTYGFAYAHLYKTNKVVDPLPTGTGPAVSYAFGFRLVLDSGSKNRFTIGVDFRHHFTKLTKINDPNNVAPISGMHIADFGLYFTLSAFYGGGPTIGEDAKHLFYHKDYVAAREKFREFLTRYPTHASAARAQWYLNECNRLIPEQLVKEGLSFDDRGLTGSALHKYLKARSLTSDSSLVGGLNDRIRQIGEKQMERARQYLSDQKFDDALNLMTQTSNYYEPAHIQLPHFQAEVTLAKGRFAMENKLYFRALEMVNQAVTDAPDLQIEADLLRYDIAVKLIREANTIRDPSAVQLMIRSLETAKSLTGDLGKHNEEILAELHQELATWEERQMRTRINKRMDAERQKMLERNRKRIKIGMTIPEVQDILGNPESLEHKQTADGKDAQLWFYTLKDGSNLQLSFLDFILFKIEKLESTSK